MARPVARKCEIIFWIVIFLFILPIDAEERYVNIILRPRDWVDPTKADGFICGIDSTLDSGRLIAELNTNYIFGQIDQTKDSNSKYRTAVYDVMYFDEEENPHNMLDPLPYFMEKEGNRLFTLFTAPRSVQCNSQTFSDAGNAGKGYYPVFVGVSSNFSEAVDQFISEAHIFKTFYDGKLPKLCATGLSMRQEAAESRTNELTMLFNFFLNGDVRNFEASKLKSCPMIADTWKSIGNSKLFDTSAELIFNEKNITVMESDGFAKIVIQRTCSLNEKTVGFVSTNLVSSGGDCVPASENDFVPYTGTIVFKEHQKEAEVIIRVKEDDEEEAPECFIVNLKKVSEAMPKNRRKRAKTWFWQSEVKVVINPDATKPYEIGTPEQVGKRIIDLWETSLISNLIFERDLFTKENEFTQNIILTYLTFELIIPNLTLLPYQFEEEEDFNIGSKMDENIKLQIANCYEGNLKGCGVTTTKSCDMTASALSMTFLKDIKRWKMKHPAYQIKHPYTLIPWDKGLSFFEEELNYNRIIKVELGVRGTACGNHLFVMWKSSSGKIGIVHGWQGIFHFRQLYHESWEEVSTHLQDMLKPDTSIHQRESPEHATRIKTQMNGFKGLFGETVNDVGFISEFIDDPKVVEPNIIELRDIVAGFPSDKVPSIGDVCLSSQVFETNYEEMPETRKLCHKEIQQRAQKMQELADKIKIY